MSKEELRKSYQQIPNKKLVEIITFESAHLNENALTVVKEEIERRGLSDRLLNAIEASTKEYTQEEFNFYLNTICNLPDPITGETGTKLNATHLILCKGLPLAGCSVKHFIYFGTPNNILKKIEETNLATNGTCWMGLPWSIFSWLNAINHNRMKAFKYDEEPSETLVNFVKENIGFIEMNKEHPENLLISLRNIMR